MKATLKSLIAVLGLSAVAINTWAASITAVRSWRAPDNTRIVLDLSEQVLYRQINSNNNKQLVLELDDTSAAVSTLTLPTRIGLVQNVLLESVGSKQRLIINLSDEVKPKVFMLAANEKLSPRLVIDLYDKVVMQPAATTVDEPVAANNEGRPVVVVVDAGHGGEDSGAIGATGNYEKHVTLSIAKKLVDILRKKEGFKAYLTRDGDYFIPLVERRKIARNRYKADIFISVHADAALSPLAKGASVFALSRKGANVATSRFAQAIADRENKSDLIGGVDNSHVGKDSQLTNILADMVVEGS
ncbi:MAG TPA: N-acetylmuramoyl-L-alanine amidase, partial [Agitococcus sp.]|nr:N-acetylmuramoyl-L-alanine amidase [Agitococcus sp.]